MGMCAYRDVSGLFAPTTGTERSSASSYLSHGFGYMKPEPNMKIEDEEDLLYGESGNAFKVTSVSFLRALIMHAVLTSILLHRW